MQERCTCGALLPDDALFCHKCGKPQREILAVEPEAPPPLPPPAPAPTPVAPPPISFHNGLAVRIGLITGLLAVVLSSPIARIAPPLAIISLAGAGYLAVFLYRWRTGQRLSTRSGAHLGWICGVFEFVLSAVPAAVLFSQPSSIDLLKTQWRQYGMSEAQINQALTELHNPATIVVIAIFAFALFTILPAFGGALGAKFLKRD